MVAEGWEKDVRPSDENLVASRKLGSFDIWPIGRNDD